ncbi:sigma-70 family RNA polymerase sigma factor (plasmid) [Acaryochloris sp. 'Moss Beach']|uniref:sigma-70 family RNA polymerase sigma factor n=1 Tax=Acaryochloris TaxID=155977 RepID=UPI001BAF9A0B|nr:MULTISPECIES: sigma-70 family RNA polymerase sigma factor [Acaryochloris]QUY40370.1 sigma-70 family RNA polymerase sigma factor [Acaryochloris marina S15]UJB72382.1 sigma-70 family RNA polymerase sigma factor [Acaryochloris sp. 'Moss Beach']
MDQALLELLLQAHSHLQGSIPQQQAFAQLLQLTGRSHEDVLERQLLELVLKARTHPSKSVAKQERLTRLIMLIEQSERFSRLRRYAHYYSPPMFEDLYNEVKQKTWIYICKKLELYRPNRTVMAWANSILRFKFLEVINEQNLQLTLYYDPQVLEYIAPNIGIETSQTEDYENLRLFLENDPEQLLSTYSINNYPEITFQYLAIAHHIQGKTWTELSTQTGITIRNLSCFFQLKLRKLLPYFRRYL